MEIPAQPLLEESEFMGKLVESSLLGLIESGHIKAKGKTRVQLLRAALRCLSSGKVELSPVVDHTKTLEEVAKDIQKKNAALAVTLYVVSLEHTLNGMISRASARKKLSPVHKEALIRDTNIRAKFVLLHVMLGIPIPKKQYDLFTLAVRTRNEFVHYKWEETDLKHDARVTSSIRAAVLVIGYLEDIFISKFRQGLKHLPQA